MNIILFNPQEIQSPLSLSDERAKHILKILHKNIGESFDAGIIDGSAGSALITAINSDSISFEFTPLSDGKLLYPLTMIIGFPRPIQLKRLLRDIASLGVCSVHLTGTELGEKSYMQSSLADRDSAYQMLLDGSIQAKSTHVPQIFLHNTLADCLKAISNNQTDILKAAPDNVKPKCTLSELIGNKQSYSHIYCAIGSERGWTDNERNLLIDSGFTLCSMGQRVLRTETAATTAVSIILNQGLKVI